MNSIDTLGHQFHLHAWKSTVNCNFQAYNRKAPSEFIQVIGTCHLVFVAPVDFTQSRQAKTSKFRTWSTSEVHKTASNRWSQDAYDHRLYLEAVLWSWASCWPWSRASHTHDNKTTNLSDAVGRLAWVRRSRLRGRGQDFISSSPSDRAGHVLRQFDYP